MASNQWKQVRLGGLIDIKHGYAFEGRYFRDELPGDVLLTPGNFSIGGGFKSDKLKFYVGPIPADFVLSEGDLIVTMTDLSKRADTLGYPAIVPKPHEGRFLHNQRLGKVTIRSEDQLDARFLFYVLCTREYRHEVLASATGSTVKHTSPSRIKAHRFKLPSLLEQKAIAHVLGMLDDKIELNRRMNETLEAMARAIFKSWFVDFDPVRANAEGRRLKGLDPAIQKLFPDRFENSPLGPIPRGWSVKPLSGAVEVNPRRILPKAQVAPYVEMANMPTVSPRPLGWIDREFTSGMKFINGDVLVARITPCLENGKTAYVDFLDDGQVGWGSTEYIVLRSKPLLPLEYAYFLARSEEFRQHAIANMTGSSGRQRVPVSCFDGFLVTVPPEAVAQRFGEAAASVLQTIKAKDEESHTLAAVRDALLPKLLSGGVRVNTVREQVEETTQ